MVNVVVGGSTHKFVGSTPIQWNLKQGVLLGCSQWDAGRVATGNKLGRVEGRAHDGGGHRENKMAVSRAL